MEAEAAARQHAEELARDVDRALDDERRAAAARIAEAEEAVTVARGERDTALAAAGQARTDATRVSEQDQQRHAAELAAPAAQLAAANDTIAALREQLARDQAALDRERAEQHRLVGLLHDIITSRPAAPTSNGGQQPQARRQHRAPACGYGRQRHQPPPRPAAVTAAAPQRPGHPRPGRGSPPTSTSRPAMKGHPMTLTDPVGPDLKRHLRALKLGKLPATLPDRLTLARQTTSPTPTSSS